MTTAAYEVIQTRNVSTGVATLVTQFNSVWVGSDDHAGEVEFSMMFGGDE